jgi:mycofactocin precursor peptide peptidase
MVEAHAEKRLGGRTWPEIDASEPTVLLVPVGSCEQHGPHLPLDTDTRIAVAVCEAVAARRDDAVVAPAVAYGSSGEHQAFPGTISIGTEALRALLVEIGRSAFPSTGPAPHRAVVFANGHGGNLDAVRAATSLLAAEGRPAAPWWPTLPTGDAHAGRTETSLLLAIAPEVVRPDRPVGATAPLAELLPALRAGGVSTVAPNGVLGDAREASAPEGHRLLAALADDLEAAIDQACTGS